MTAALRPSEKPRTIWIVALCCAKIAGCCCSAWQVDMSWLGGVAVVLFAVAIFAGAFLSVEVDRRRRQRSQGTQYQPHVKTH